MTKSVTRRKVKPDRSGDPTNDRASAERLHEAHEELLRVSRGADLVKWLYRVGAAVYGVATIFAIVALARPDVPLRDGVLVVALTTLLSLLLLVAAIEMLFSPVVWNVVVALLATFVAFLHAVGPNPLGVALPGAVALAALLWLALIPTLRFQRLIAAHEDLFILHHASTATRRSLRGHTLDEQHERLVAARHRAAHRALGASVGAAAAVLLLSTAGTSAVLAKARPEALSEAGARFEAAWNAGDAAALGALFDERTRAEWAPWIAARLVALGWSPKAPLLRGGQETWEDDGVYVDYAVGEDKVSAFWRRSGPRWTLVQVALPEPPFGEALDAFLAAWAATDLDSIVAYFAKDHQQTMREQLVDALGNRGWTALPAVLDTKQATLDDGSRSVDLVIGGEGDVLTRWHLRKDASWKLHYLRLPKR